MRRGARAVLKWFSALFVALILVAVFLAGSGIFRLYNVKNSDDCDKTGAHCIANSKTLDPHRAVGSLLILLAIVFLIVALVAWLPSPAFPLIPFPATVEMIPVVRLTRRTRKLSESARWSSGAAAP